MIVVRASSLDAVADPARPVIFFACRTVVLTARGTQNEVPKHLTLEKVHALGICQISYPKLHGHAYHEVVALT